MSIDTYLFGVQVRRIQPGHVFREAHGLVAYADGVLDDGLELVLCVAGAELARVGVHRERHGGGYCVALACVCVSEDW